ncbi:hypothetical protein CBS101457_003680 [Exobasidium rhododendri]|nr:hypothetical protein CBS101457_003680 [Exobasidium rhododendri]
MSAATDVSHPNATKEIMMGVSSSPPTVTTGAAEATLKNGISVSKMTSRSANTVPSDKVRLDVLLISGQRKFFDFDAQKTAKEVRETIWEDWPQDWPPRPMNPSAIRLLHLGHILEDKFVLSPGSGEQSASAPPTLRGMPLGKGTVVHLLLRQARTKEDGDEDSLKKATATSGCCNCIIC